MSHDHPIGEKMHMRVAQPRGGETSGKSITRVEARRGSRSRRGACRQDAALTRGPLLQMTLSGNPAKTRPFVKTISAFGRKGMDRSRFWGRLADRGGRGPRMPGIRPLTGL